MTSLNEALEAARDLLQIDGVVGVAEGQCAGKPCVVVMLDRPIQQLDALLPTAVRGVPVDVRTVGQITPQGT